MSKDAIIAINELIKVGKNRLESQEEEQVAVALINKIEELKSKLNSPNLNLKKDLESLNIFDIKKYLELNWLIETDIIYKYNNFFYQFFIFLQIKKILRLYLSYFMLTNLKLKLLLIKHF